MCASPRIISKVLVTGGAGFIGCNLVRHLLRARPALHIVTYDLLTYAGTLDNLQELPDPDLWRRPTEPRLAPRDDHCAALLAIVERGRAGETYHVGGGNQPTNLALVTQLHGLLDPSAVPSLLHVADRPGHDRRYALSTAKLEHELSWRPAHDLVMGLAATVSWYCANDAWMTARCEHPEFQRWFELNYTRRVSP